MILQDPDIRMWYHVTLHHKRAQTSFGGMVYIIKGSLVCSSHMCISGPMKCGYIACYKHGQCAYLHTVVAIVDDTFVGLIALFRSH